MKKVLFLMVLSLTLYSCKKSNASVSASAETENNNALNANIDNTIKTYEDLGIFSGIVLVAKKGTVIYHKAFGLADRTSKKPNDLNTLFDIGSMNKTFTAIVIKQLASEGKLDLNDKLLKYVDGFKDPNAEKITINHLLNHEAGFGDYHTESYFDLPKKDQMLHAIVARAKPQKLFFEPGTEQEYSNLGFVILGAVIEKASGKSYFENVKKRIIEPLQLKNTYLNNFEGLNARVAKGYYFTPLGVLEENASIQDVPNPDGGFLSTTKDIMTFYRSYYYNQLLLSEDFKAKDPEFEFLKNLPPGKATGAAGGFEGFNTALFQVISDDLTIIVFANMDEPVAEHIALDILALTRDETPNKPKLPAIQNVRIEFEKNNLQYIKDNFADLTTNFHPEDPKDLILNDLGYAYLYAAKEPEKALQLFKLNTELFPDIPNCWDSYGEALLQNGNTKEGQLAYQKALQLDPGLESAKNALEKLK